MTILHIKYFIVTAECLNFTNAAKQLFITQPSLSRQIISIESELNVLLFIRHENHTIELTPAGLILLEEFKKIYDLYTKAIEKVQKTAFNITGSLKIGVLQETYIGDFMPSIVNEFFLTYPNIHIDLNNYSFSELIQQLYNKKLDIIFTLYFSVVDLDNLNLYTISESKDFIAMSKSHHLANFSSLTWDNLKNERFIVLSKEDCETSFDLIIKEFKKMKVCPEFIYAPNVQTLRLWVESGYGIAIIDSRNELHFHPNIITHEFESSWNPSLTMVWSKSNKNPMIPIFIDILKQTFTNKK